MDNVKSKNVSFLKAILSTYKYIHIILYFELFFHLSRASLGFFEGGIPFTYDMIRMQLTYGVDITNGCHAEEIVMMMPIIQLELGS